MHEGCSRRKQPKPSKMTNKAVKPAEMKIEVDEVSAFDSSPQANGDSNGIVITIGTILGPFPVKKAQTEDLESANLYSVGTFLGYYLLIIKQYRVLSIHMFIIYSRDYEGGGGA